jgi:Ca2+/Na+ antiporter
LGYVFIAIGNALPDGLATISLAKIGEAKMGITAGLATNLFALLIGFETSTLFALLA